MICGHSFFITGCVGPGQSLRKLEYARTSTASWEFLTQNFPWCPGPQGTRERKASWEDLSSHRLWRLRSQPKGVRFPLPDYANNNRPV